MKTRLFKLGLIGTILAALCCFTPVLVILLGAIGLAAFIGWQDIILLPVLIIFVAITGYAVIVKK